MGFLNQLAPLRPRLGVGSALNPASSDIVQPPPALLSPALAGTGSLLQGHVFFIFIAL